MPLKIDTTKLNKLDRIIPRCQVVDIPAGAAPKNVTVQLPGGDGARILVRWFGFPAIVTNDYVRIQRRGSDNQFDIIGTDLSTGTQAVLDKLDATTAPTANDDSTDGYGVGSHWIDVTNDDAYICLDATATAAVWEQVNGGGGGAWPAADKVNISTTEYATWALAEAAFVGGEQAIVGEGSYTSDAPTISTSTAILGSGIDVSILTTSASDEVLIISNSSQPILSSLTLSNTKATSNPKALQVTSGGVNAYGCKFETTGGTAGTNYGTFLSGAGNNHWFWNCIWDVQAASTNNYAIYINDGDYVNCWAPDIRNGDIYISQGTLILRNPAIVGNITATGASTTVYVIGGVVGGNITQASGATVELFNSPFVTGTLSGTIGGWYQDANSTLKPAIGMPVFYAQKSAAQNDLTSGVETKIQIDNALVDTIGDFDDTTNYRYDVSIAGTYFIYGRVSYINDITDQASIAARIKVTGSTKATGSVRTSSTAAQGANVFALVSMTSSDYVELYGIQSTGNNTVDIYVNENTFIGGFLVAWA